MNKKIAFIGGGNMAQSIIHGLVAAAICPPENILVSGPHPEKLTNLSDMGIQVHKDNRVLVQLADCIVLSVKPNIVPLVLDEIRDLVTAEKLVISVANGISIQALSRMLNPDSRIIRAMPNTPARIGQGLSGLCHSASASDEDIADASAIFESCGRVEWIDESLLDAVVGIAGSAPAYFFMMLEAMADAAVKAGMKRDMAYRIAAQAMQGSAALVSQTGKHPASLKDEVCSPAGATIEAVQALEDRGFRSAVMAAVLAATDFSKLASQEA